MSRDEFRALTPWSFFLPVALAVASGVLVANGVGAALSGGDGADEPAAETVDAAVPGEAGGAPATAGDSAQAAVAAKEPAPAGPLPVLEPVSLPGPSGARRDGETRACIGGTVAVRAENGWEQEVIEDAPARCVPSSS